MDVLPWKIPPSLTLDKTSGSDNIMGHFPLKEDTAVSHVWSAAQQHPQKGNQLSQHYWEGFSQPSPRQAEKELSWRVGEKPEDML